MCTYCTTQGTNVEQVSSCEKCPEHNHQVKVTILNHSFAMFLLCGIICKQRITEYEKGLWLF